MIRKVFIALFLISFASAACSQNEQSGISTALSSDKAITAFSFLNPAATGNINESAKTIDVIMPPGTNLNKLIATFTTTGSRVKVGSTVQVSGSTQNDFTNSVEYVVEAADGSIATYTVTVKSLTGYKFTAQIDYINGSPTIPALVGDIVTGTFSFDSTIPNHYISVNQGGYFQRPPAGVQVQIESIILNADLSSFTGYHIDIYNDESDVDPIRDSVSWYVNDTQVASVYGLDYFQMIFKLEDLTATALNDTAIPTNLVLSDFDNPYFSISGTKTINGMGTGLWLLTRKLLHCVESIIQLVGWAFLRCPTYKYR